MLFLAMRYVDGTDLAQLIAREGALEPAPRDLAARAGRGGAGRGAREGSRPPRRQALERPDRRRRRQGALLPRRLRPDEAHGLAQRRLRPRRRRRHARLRRARADHGRRRRRARRRLLARLRPLRVPDRAVAVPAGDRRRRCCGRTCTRSHGRRARPGPSCRRRSTPCSARALAKEPGRRYGTAGELLGAARSSLGLVEAPPAPTDKRLQWVFGAVVLALATAAALGLLLTRDSGGGLTSVAPNSVGVIDAATNELVAEVPVGLDPEGIAVGRGRGLGRERRGRDGLADRSRGHGGSRPDDPRRRLPGRCRRRLRRGLGRARRAGRARAHQPRAESGRAARLGARWRHRLRRTHRR